MRTKSKSSTTVSMRPLELQLPAEGRDQLDLHAGQVDGGGGHEEVLHARGLDAVLERLVPHDHVVHGQLEVPGLHAQPGGGVALGVEVDDEDPVALLGQRRPEVDRGGGLAHAALLVGDGDDPRQLPDGRLGAVEQLGRLAPDGRCPLHVILAVARPRRRRLGDLLGRLRLGRRGDLWLGLGNCCRSGLRGGGHGRGRGRLCCGHLSGRGGRRLASGGGDACGSAGGVASGSGVGLGDQALDRVDRGRALARRGHRFHVVVVRCGIWSGRRCPRIFPVLAPDAHQAGSPRRRITAPILACPQP